MGGGEGGSLQGPFFDFSGEKPQMGASLGTNMGTKMGTKKWGGLVPFLVWRGSLSCLQVYLY